MDSWLNKVHEGHALHLLKKMPSDSVDLVITSPPYWGLRFYGEGTVTSWPDGWKGQLGLEPNYQLFVKHLVSILHEVKRVLKPSGSLYLNLGDTYQNKCMIGMPWRVALAMMDKDGWILRNSIIWHKPNHMPMSVRDRLTNGYEFIFHFVKSQKYYYNLDAIREPLANPMRPNLDGGSATQQGIPRTPVKYQKRMDARRVMKRYQGKFSGAGESSEALAKQTLRTRGFGSPRARNERDEKGKYGQSELAKQTLRTRGHSGYHDKEGNLLVNPFGKNPGDVWKIPTHPFPEAHFAVFPMAICWKPILSSCPPNGIVLDPFGGSGTVALATKILNINNKMPKRDDLVKILSNFKDGVKPLSCAAERNWIILEMSKEYCAIAEKRLLI